MNRGKVAAGLTVILLGGSILVTILAALPSPTATEVETPWVGPWLWEIRGLDMAIQALLILAGVLGVLLLLGGREGQG